MSRSINHLKQLATMLHVRAPMPMHASEVAVFSDQSAGAGKTAISEANPMLMISHDGHGPIREEPDIHIEKWTSQFQHHACWLGTYTSSCLLHLVLFEDRRDLENLVPLSLNGSPKNRHVIAFQ